ncbi:hypothetical protein NDU88_003811, partial [Pleurodeles waltl]
VERWGELAREGTLLLWDELVRITDGSLSRLKYLQIREWEKEIKGGLGVVNALEDSFLDLADSAPVKRLA